MAWGSTVELKTPLEATSSSFAYYEYVAYLGNSEAFDKDGNDEIFFVDLETTKQGGCAYTVHAYTVHAYTVHDVPTLYMLEMMRVWRSRVNASLMNGMAGYVTEAMFEMWFSRLQAVHTLLRGDPCDVHCEQARGETAMMKTIDYLEEKVAEQV